MPDFDPDTLFDRDPELAEIRLEFSKGLAVRLSQLEDSIASLREGFDADAVETFYRAAHSLKGAAPAFGAPDVARHAIDLAESGLAWTDSEGVEADELAAADEVLSRLRAAIERYRRFVEDGEFRMEGEA